jgi:PAS domain S-box-containing protein
MQVNNQIISSLNQRGDEVINILERITDGFYALDRDWNIIYWNKEAEVMLGKTRQEVLGKSLWDCFPDAVNMNFYTLYRQAIAEQKPVHFEGYYPPRDIWAELNVYPSEDGLSIFFKNINERKHAEEEIRKLSIIARETVNAVSLVNLDGSISWINNAFTRITGYSFREAVGRSQHELLNGEETDLVTVLVMRDHFSKKELFNSEILCYTKTGQKIWLSFSAQPFRDLNGIVNQYFFIMTDVTEQKKLRTELDAHQKRTTRAVIMAQEKERGVIGQELHDNVNQVLTSIKLYVELSLDENGNKRPLLEKSVQLLQESISEIRNISQRLSSPMLGAISLKESVIDLVDKISATNKFIIHTDLNSLDELNVSEELHLAIYRILQEHFTNILKHADATHVQIYFDIIDDDLTLKVIDDGKGFDIKAKRPGIGLHNMLTRAQSVKGMLTINSSKGLGCALIARFPVNDHSGE